MRAVKIIGIVAALMIAGAVLALWWTGRPPRRPPNLSANALYIERGAVPFKLSNTGEWLDCWFDERERAAHCKLTNMNGWSEFEDIFLPYSGQTAVLPADLVLDRRRTGNLWGGTYEKGTLYPIVYSTKRQHFASAKRV